VFPSVVQDTCEAHHSGDTANRETSMNTIGRTLGLSLFSLLLGALPVVSAAAADEAAEVAALHAVDDAWAKAYNGGNVEGLVALYDENALLMPPGAPGARGKAAIRAFFKNDVAGSQKAGITFALGAKPDGGAVGDWAGSPAPTPSRTSRAR
jgi:hypothetical protein